MGLWEILMGIVFIYFLDISWTNQLIKDILERVTIMRLIVSCIS